MMKYMDLMLFKRENGPLFYILVAIGSGKSLFGQHFFDVQLQNTTADRVRT